MQTVTENIGFISAFLISTLLVNMVFGNKMTNQFLVLVLIGMVLYPPNTEELTSLIGKVNS